MNQIENLETFKMGQCYYCDNKVYVMLVKGDDVLFKNSSEKDRFLCNDCLVELARSMYASHASYCNARGIETRYTRTVYDNWADIIWKMIGHLRAMSKLDKWNDKEAIKRDREEKEREKKIKFINLTSPKTNKAKRKKRYDKKVVFYTCLSFSIGFALGTILNTLLSNGG